MEYHFVGFVAAGAVMQKFSISAIMPFIFILTWLDSNFSIDYIKSNMYIKI